MCSAHPRMDQAILLKEQGGRMMSEAEREVVPLGLMRTIG